MLVSDGNVQVMAGARSKVTAHGQTAVPAEVRRKLGIGPGSVLEWHEEGERVVVRRAGRYTSEDVHRASFPYRGGDESRGAPKPEET
jgi:AbrB family looped-hinge helix DNA binding protein